MSINPAKGQGIIGEILLFAVTIFLSFVIFIILSASGTGEQSQAAEKEVESNMESIRHRSALTSMLNGMVWRSPSVDDRYEDLSALKLTSYYFSSNGDIHIDNRSYDRTDVESDLQSYYDYRMGQYFLNLPEQMDHSLNITYGDQYIEVEDIDDRGGSWSSIEVPFQLSDDRTGEITMYVRGSGGVFKVE